MYPLPSLRHLLRRRCNPIAGQVFQRRSADTSVGLTPRQTKATERIPLPPGQYSCVPLRLSCDRAVVSRRPPNGGSLSGRHKLTLVCQWRCVALKAPPSLLSAKMLRFIRKSSAIAWSLQGKPKVDQNRRLAPRSEERRVGKECRSRSSACH